MCRLPRPFPVVPDFLSSALLSLTGLLQPRLLERLYSVSSKILVPKAPFGFAAVIEIISCYRDGFQ